jgi:enamine deaminase RidA (YjgF/YER057c/UK114 family)
LIHAPLASYSHQIELRGPERLLVLSGQVGVALDGRLADDPAEQLELALDNVLRKLEAAAMDAGHLVKLTLYSCRRSMRIHGARFSPGGLAGTNLA